MAWKFKRYKIKWNKKKKRFGIRRRNRQKSRAAFIRAKRNRPKIRRALRKARVKGRVTRRKNKASGIFSKLKRARQRWKNIIKSDKDLDLFLNLLNEENIAELDLELDDSDIDSLVEELKSIQRNLELDDQDEKKELDDFVTDSVEFLENIDINEIDEEEQEFIEEIVSFVEQYGEEAGLLDDDEE